MFCSVLFLLGGPSGGCLCSSKSSGRATTETIRKTATTRTTKQQKKQTKHKKLFTTPGPPKPPPGPPKPNRSKQKTNYKHIKNTVYSGVDRGNPQGKDFGRLPGVFEGCLGKSFPCKNPKKNKQKNNKK